MKLNEKSKKLIDILIEKRIKILKEGILFDVNSVKKIEQILLKQIHAPYKIIQISDVLGKEKIYMILRLSIDNKKDWPLHLFMNSKYMLFQITNDGRIELFKKAPEIKKNFKKIKVKNVSEVINKINDYIRKVK